MKISNQSKAEILLEALPYIKKYAGETVVIKYGGSAMTDENLKKMVVKDIVLLRQIGVNCVVVHGGGPEISATLGKIGVETRFVNGLRVTDEESIGVVQMVLAGKINKDLVALFGSMDSKALGLCGIDGKLLEAEPLDPSLGYVGAVKAVDPKPILDALERGYIPVVAPLGIGADGKVYNINADTAAARIAGALRAKSFINMTDEKGILRDKDEPSSLIREVSASEAGELISEGIVSGGMTPKVRCCIEAIRRGVKKVFIIDGREPHSLIIEVLSDEGIGTMFY